MIHNFEVDDDKEIYLVISVDPKNPNHNTAGINGKVDLLEAYIAAQMLADEDYYTILTEAARIAASIKDKKNGKEHSHSNERTDL